MLEDILQGRINNVRYLPLQFSHERRHAVYCVPRLSRLPQTMAEKTGSRIESLAYLTLFHHH